MQISPDLLKNTCTVLGRLPPTGLVHVNRSRFSSIVQEPITEGSHRGKVMFPQGSCPNCPSFLVTPLIRRSDGSDCWLGAAAGLSCRSLRHTTDDLPSLPRHPTSAEPNPALRRPPPVNSLSQAMIACPSRSLLAISSFPRRLYGFVGNRQKKAHRQ